MKNRILVGVFDLHYPMHSQKLWDAALELIKDLKPDYFVFGGDNMDMTPVSHWLHAGGQFRTLEGKRILEDYQGFQKEMDRVEAVLPKKCEKVFLKGNHEDWVEQAIDKNPQGEGYWEIENNLNLKYWKVVEYGDVYPVGKAYLMHGVYTNDGHAKKTVTTYGHSVFYGHDHTYQAYTATTPIGNESHTGTSVPCACDMNPDYNRNKPNRWLQGLLVMYIKPDGTFHDYVIKAVNSKFIFNGKQY